MKLTEVAGAAFDEKTAKNMAKILKVVKKEAARFGPNTIEVTPSSYLKGEIAVHYQRWWRPETVEDAFQEIREAIKTADSDGHIAKLEAGDQCSGDKYAEALLSGLRPGMALKVEALFPTISFEITWKNIVSSKR